VAQVSAAPFELKFMYCSSSPMVPMCPAISDELPTEASPETGHHNRDNWQLISCGTIPLLIIVLSFTENITVKQPKPNYYD
jgi:hypothetical protein